MSYRKCNKFFFVASVPHSLQLGSRLQRGIVLGVLNYIWGCVLQVTAMDDDSAGISGYLSLTGTEFSNMSQADQADAVARLNVFSRVEPSHKSLLVDRLREQVRPVTPDPALHFNTMHVSCLPVGSGTIRKGRYVLCLVLLAMSSEHATHVVVISFRMIICSRFRICCYVGSRLTWGRKR